MTKGNQGRFLLLYGSQTGQAKAIAEEIFETAPNHGFHPEMHCLSMTDKKFSLEKETCMVMVVSTTGDGEPPETACKFWRRLKKKTLPDDHFAKLNYALLGLGDSNYNNFCRNPKNFDKRLEELGAKRFHPSGFADDAVGLEVAVEPWIEALWPALRKHLGVNSMSNGVPDAAESLRTFGEDQTEVINGIESLENQVPPILDKTTPSDQTSETRTESVLRTVNKNDPQTVNKDESRTTEPFLGNDSKNPPDDARTKKAQDAIDSGTSKVEASRSSNDVGASRTSQDGGPSLTCSVPPLSESALTLPVRPAEYLQVKLEPSLKMNIDPLSPQGSASYPSAKSSVTKATIVSATQLTRDDAVKTALDIELDISDTKIDYQPGDAFSIICPNPSAEVDLLMEQLDIAHQAEQVFTISLLENTKKRRAAVPDYIPQPCTVRHALTHCCDIRTPPKKAFLRMLVEHITNEHEKRRLQELCSKQGASDYATYIRNANVSILDVLQAFPSCKPRLDALLEHLPRLQPRPYSISSSPLVNPSRLHFVFNIIEFPLTSGRAMARKGVCTGWLNTKTKGLQDEGCSKDNNKEIDKEMAALALRDELQIPIFTRTNTHFRLPDDPSTPIIMIGPGTGVAPFVGFLEHREMLQRKAAENEEGEIPKFGSSWLFFGCRHKERDYLYRDKLQHFVDNQVLTKLVVSFSRDSTDSSSPCYVQDNLRLHADDVLDLLLEKKAVLYVCGDAKNMARNVNETLLELISKRTGKGPYESTVMLAKLREEKRYREDIWT